MYVFGVIQVHIFPHLDCMRRDAPYLSILSLNARNADHNNSKYGHISRGDLVT